MAQLETDILADLIDKKHQCLTALRDLGRRQLALVQGGELPPLLKVLATKNRLIEYLQQLERQLEPFQSQDPDARQWRSPADRTACAQQAEACRQLWNEVIQQEQQSEQELTQRRDEAATRLQGMHTAHQARDAYCDPPASGTSGMLDLTSES